MWRSQPRRSSSNSIFIDWVEQATSRTQKRKEKRFVSQETRHHPTHRESHEGIGNLPFPSIHPSIAGVFLFFLFALDLKKRKEKRTWFLLLFIHSLNFSFFGLFSFDCHIGRWMAGPLKIRNGEKITHFTLPWRKSFFFYWYSLVSLGKNRDIDHLMVVPRSSSQRTELLVVAISNGANKKKRERERPS